MAACGAVSWAGTRGAIPLLPKLSIASDSTSQAKNLSWLFVVSIRQKMGGIFFFLSGLSYQDNKKKSRRGTGESDAGKRDCLGWVLRTMTGACTILK